MEGSQNEHIPEESAQFMSKMCEGKLHLFQLTGIKKPLKALDWIYEGSEESTRLARKFAKYEAMKEILAKPTRERLELYEKFVESKEWKDLTQCSYCDCPMKREKV